MRLLARTLAITIAITSLLATAIHADDEDKKPKPPVEDWLLLGPISTPYPAFSDEDKKKPSAGTLLGYSHLDREGLWPQEGTTVPLTSGSTKWSSRSRPIRPSIRSSIWPSALIW